VVTSKSRKSWRERTPGLRSDRLSGLRVVDRVPEYVGDIPRTVPFEHPQPRFDGAGNGGGQRARARDGVEALSAVVVDRRRVRGRTLSHDDCRSVAGRCDDRDQVATRPVEVRFDDVQDEAGGDGRVERIPAAFEHRLGHRGGGPVSGRSHPERARQSRTRQKWRGRREGVGRGLGQHAGSMRSSWIGCNLMIGECSSVGRRASSGTLDRSGVVFGPPRH
jgi:hypothetical protein